MVFHGGDIFGGVRNQGGDLCSQRDTAATSAGAARCHRWRWFLSRSSAGRFLVSEVATMARGSLAIVGGGSWLTMAGAVSMSARCHGGDIFGGRIFGGGSCRARDDGGDIFGDLSRARGSRCRRAVSRSSAVTMAARLSGSLSMAGRWRPQEPARRGSLARDVVAIVAAGGANGVTR